MSFVTVAGIPVQRGRITFDLIGTWECEAWVAAEKVADVAGSVTLSVGDTDLTGFATAGQDPGAQVSVRIVGGAGGLGAAVTAQGYNEDATAETIFTQALQAGSEQLSSADSDAGILAKVQRWSRLSGTVSEAMRALAKHLGCSWRVLDDGKVWVGPEQWAAVTPDHILEDEQATRKLMTIAIDELGVRPGDKFRDQQITQATYRFDGRRMRADLSWGDTTDELSMLLGVLIRREIGTSVDASAIYAYQIDSQESDGRLNVRSTDSRLPDLPKVPVKFGLMGITENQLVGGTAYLTHENGDLSRPVIVGVAPDQGKTLVIECTDKITLKVGGMSVELSTSAVSLGTGAQKVALADKVDARFTAIETFLTSHTHAGVTTGPGSTGPAPGAPQGQSVAANDVSAS